MATEVADIPLLKDNFNNLSEAIRNDAELQKILPGLDDLLADEASDDVNVSLEQFTRRLLKIYEDSSEPLYTSAVSGYTAAERDSVQQFINGASYEKAAEGFRSGPTKGTREEFRNMHNTRLIDLQDLCALDAKNGSNNQDQREGVDDLLEKKTPIPVG
jgi:hypothetical protein